MSGRSGSTSGGVPFLHEKRIKEEADLLLAEYGQRHQPVVAPPVPVEDILEIHLQLLFEIADLRAQFGFADVLGAIWINEQTVRVDQSLEPTSNPKKLGRYRFTLAHEIGHWRLHRSLYLENAAQGNLFGAPGAPAYVCRKAEAKKPVEWQADQFAANLLMPAALVKSAWSGWRGRLDPVVLDDVRGDHEEEACRRVEAFGDPSQPDQIESAILELFAKPMADMFQVSPQSMRIALEGSGWLLRRREPSLFE